MMKFYIQAFSFVCVLVVLLSGCDELGRLQQPKADAVAVLTAADGHEIQGTVSFARVNKGVRIIARVNGLTPGDHGIHVHEFGDCRAADFSSAGGHFNPHNQSHGAPTDEVRHLGDLGNLTADEGGTGKLDTVDALLTLDGPESIVGRSVVIHADADDFKTQPSGGAGARVACGVIGYAKK
jgi:Cu-Zn family superoxide dismutase